MLRAVIFDFDGVITDSEILHFRAINQVLAHYGTQITKNDYYKKYLGFNDADCYEAFINHGLLKTGTHQIKDLIEQKKEIFEQLAQAEGEMIEGVHDFLEMLEQNSVPMAICSGALSAEVELVLEKAHLRHLFEVIVAAECGHRRFSLGAGGR
ncbi:MAG: HAD family phosphatase [Phycisphaerales bacterium]|jgi:beta-phosphoglucomutase-like phosphatase (HAD superfamily)